MIQRRQTHLLIILLLILPLTGCNLPAFRSSLPGGVDPDSDLLAEPLPPLPETIINFQVSVPAGSFSEETVYLSVLDEITGLALNPETFPMQVESTVTGTLSSSVHTVSLPFAIGSVVKYRYERQSGSIRVSEHSGDGSPVRYRLYYVDGPGSVQDVVSRWTDSPFTSPTGRIVGQVLDGTTGQPVPNVLVSAGGGQSISSAEGKFRLELLPPGIHNIVALSMDGSYQNFQQGARVESESTTPAQIFLTLTPTVKGVFVVRVPGETPPIVPLRLAGNFYQLGNSFATLTGGMSSQVSNMPVLSVLPDGRYTATITLPVGADLRYKYTLGDGFWNAEHNSDGSFRVRQIVVPGRNFLVEDEVQTWFAGEPNSIAFDVLVPDLTPPGDFVSLQISPLFGWTEPFPMWHLGGNRWAYILFSPLNLPGNLFYRYCRNSQCGVADDIITSGLFGPGRPAQVDTGPQTFTDQVTEWLNLPWQTNPLPLPQTAVPLRGSDYWTGVELLDAYHPSWSARMPHALDAAQSISANRIVIRPTWTFGRHAPGSAPPYLQPLPSQDMLEFDLAESIQLSHARGMNIILYPSPQFMTEVDEWWLTAPRDDSWWAAWIEQYEGFIFHHAEIASQNGASALILGGDWLAPALPGGTLVDGSPSNVPADVEFFWRELISQVRSRFSGAILWALPQENAQSPPPFLDAVDAIYLLYRITPEEQASMLQGANLNEMIAGTIDNTVLTLYTLENKPIILALSSPVDPDPQSQYSAYQAMLEVVTQRDWIGGFVSRGFYPPAALLDASPSIHGKPTQDLLRFWYQGLLGLSPSP